MRAQSNRLQLDTTVPVVLFKTSGNALQHGPLGIIRSLGRLNVPVFAMVEDGFAPAAVSRYLAGAFPMKTGNCGTEGLLDRLETIGHALGKSAILIPTDDRAAAYIAEHSEVLTPWFVFPKVSKGLPRRLANKRDLYSLCKATGTPCPETAFPGSRADVLAFIERAKFPVVLKAPEPQKRPDGTLSVQIVHTAEELLAVYRQAEQAGYPDLILQEYIPEGSAQDWVFHGYINPQTDCLVSFTGKKLRSYPAFAGSTTLGVSAPNELLRRQTESLLRSLSYAGIMDMDYRFDMRDGQYKLLDFNPRVGANFRMFESEDGIDVVRALHLDLTGRHVARSREVEGRIFVVEPFDLAATFVYMRVGGMSLGRWWRTVKGNRELAWFNWNDLAPFSIMCIRLLSRTVKRLAYAARARLRATISKIGFTIGLDGGVAEQPVHPEPVSLAISTTVEPAHAGGNDSQLRRARTS